jgi:hypothetical protein
MNRCFILGEPPIEIWAYLGFNYLTIECYGCEQVKIDIDSIPKDQISALEFISQQVKAAGIKLNETHWKNYRTLPLDYFDYDQVVAITALQHLHNVRKAEENK